MITFENVRKTYPQKGGARTVILEDLSMVFPQGRNIGILGRNGAGKSTLMRLISGAELPDQGRIRREGRISWPLGFSGGFHGSLTGRQNVRFICDIYGAEFRSVMEFVEDFAEIGTFMDMPYKTYSSGMRARVAFGACMALDFNYYLVDEVIAVGDASFQKKCKAVFAERRQRATVLLVSHSVSLLKDFCDIAGVLQDGRLVMYDDLDSAIKAHTAQNIKPRKA
ncbi:ABC transporter ATP-binding protein [Aureimonas frigidaquae]|uniref:ABC transporter domain-containing protein n=1 Tax=Aureimonas frigidaquae TaxID=424757 RepID=A0A0P0Z2J9_9HYPH|nr:ABC transporter ATP-binding protein [Aureimonas frigidaquae]BAT28213.1 hypothetical protein [Aureimonas frigidaquae]